MEIQKLDTQTRAHHPDSPSSLQSSEACPCFDNLQRESQASIDGVLQHKAVETRDVALVSGDMDMENAVAKAIAYEDATINQFKLDGRPFRVVREILLSVGDPVLTEGFPDTVVVGEKHAAIIDYKFGKVPVTWTKDNLQGIAYKEGLLQLEPSVQTVDVHFFAPHQRWSEEHQAKHYVYRFKREESAAHLLRISVVIARKHEAHRRIALRTPEFPEGDWGMAKPKHDLCIYCKHQGACPKVGALVIQTNEKYHDLTVPEEVKEYRLSRPEQVAAAYRFANQMAPILEAIKKRCVDAAVTEGLLPDNFTIIKSQHRKIKNVQAFVNVAVEQGVPAEEAVEMLSVSFKPFEDWMKAHAPKGSGAAKLREFNAALEESGITEKGTPFYFLREIKTPAEKPAIDV